MTLADVLALPWGGHRNLALRESLGVEPGEIAMVNGRGQIQLVVDDLGRANQLARIIGASVPFDRITVQQRPDRRYFVWAHNRRCDHGIDLGDSCDDCGEALRRGEPRAQQDALAGLLARLGRLS